MNKNSIRATTFRRSRYRAVISLVVGMLGTQLFASRSSLSVEPLSTIIARSCSGIGKPLTKNDIELRGKSLGFALDANAMGAVFENFAVDSLGITKNTRPIGSSVRAAATLNSREGVQSNVVPDSLGTIGIIDYDTSGRITYQQYYSSSHFHEMKLTTGAIYLSSFNHQILGYVDIATLSLAGRASSSLGTHRPTPSVEFDTPADASIGLSVITTATKDRVAVHQRIACDAQSTPSPTDMILGSRQTLNPEVYTSSVAPNVFPPAGRAAGLRR
jgi:hypothetical protein